MKNRSKFVALVLLCTTAPICLNAQTPTRPGLTIYETPAASPGSPAAPGLQRPSSVQPTNMPTTGLVQRNYAGQTEPAAPPQLNQRPPQDFFFVEDGASGPDDLAAGLSDYNSGLMSRTGSQLSGNFGGIQRAGMPSGQIQDAWNMPFDNMSSGQSAPGNIRYQWSSDLIMPVRLRDGVITNIILPDWESAEDSLIGDGNAIQAKIIRGNVVSIKSVRVGVDTSLSIIGGSGNVYTFYLRTEGRNSDVVTDFQVFVQAAPSKGSGEWFNDEKLMTVPGGAADQLVTAEGEVTITRKRAANQGDEPVPNDRRRFNMKMYEVADGDKIIAPEYVYTDGKFTYLHFPAGVTDRPVIRRVVDGVEGRVNTRVTGRHSEIVIVEALGDFVLRSGTRVVCLIEVNDRAESAS